MGVRFAIITDLHYGYPAHDTSSWDSGDSRIEGIFTKIALDQMPLALIGLGDQWQDSWDINTDGARGRAAWLEHATLPVHMIPGNHENSGGTGIGNQWDRISELFGAYGVGDNQLRNNFTVDYGNYRFILFDSAQKDQDYSENGGTTRYVVPPDTIAWLNTRLSEVVSENKIAIICLHNLIDAPATLQNANITAGQSNVLVSTGGVRLLNSELHAGVGSQIALVFAGDVVKYTTVTGVNANGNEVTIYLDETLPSVNILEWYFIQADGEAHGYHVKNQKEVRDTIEPYSANIAGVIMGHMRDDSAHSEINGITYLHTRECQSSPNFAIIELDGSEIAMAGTGDTITYNWNEFHISVDSPYADDNNNASLSSAPWGRIAYAITQAKPRVGGSVVYIAPGVYPTLYQNSTDPVIGSPGNPVTWVYEDGAVHDGAGTASYGLRLQVNNYLNVYNFTGRNVHPTTGIVLRNLGINVLFDKVNLIGPSGFGFIGNGALRNVIISDVKQSVRLENNATFCNFVIKDGDYGSGILFSGTINNVKINSGAILNGDYYHSGTGAIVIAAGMVPEIHNIIIHNCGRAVLNSEPTAVLSHIWTTDGNNTNFTPVGTSDPLIADDGRISNASPCIDAGTWITGVNDTGEADPWGNYVHRLPNIGADQGAGSPGSIQIVFEVES